MPDKDTDRDIEVPPHPYKKEIKKKEEKDIKRGNPLEGLFLLIGKLFPQSIKKKIGQMLRSAGKDSIPEQWLGGAILLAFFYAVMFTLVPLFLLRLSVLQSIVFAFVTFSLVFSLYYFTLYHAMLKTQKIDKLEPRKLLFLNKRVFVRMYHSISHFYPWNFREHMRKIILFSGDRFSTPEQWLGVSSILSLLYSVASAIFTYLLFGVYWAPVAVFLCFFVISFFVQYMLAYYKAENRRKKVEEVLPDFLQLISANIRAGMTPFAALRSSARKEFGPLEEEIEYATAKSLGTSSFTESLKEISMTINSEVLERVIGLFSSGLKSGGKLSSLLENAAQDISQNQELNAQLVSSTKMYVMFIVFNIAIGSPLMLAISMQFVEMVHGFDAASQSDEQVIEGIGGGMSDNAMMSLDFLFKISIMIITITCFIASGFLGVINEGSVRNGLKYFIPLAAFAILSFLVFRIFVGQVVGGMI